MQIVKWLCPQFSAVTGKALVRVEPGEIAEVETMLALVDGDSVGHFGVVVWLAATENEPEVEPTRHRGKAIGAGYLSPKQQFGFHNASGLRQMVRFYVVDVSRD